MCLLELGCNNYYFHVPKKKEKKSGQGHVNKINRWKNLARKNKKDADAKFNHTALKGTSVGQPIKPP